MAAVDSLMVRAARRRRLSAMLLVLEERGGDEIAVLEGVADGMIQGLDVYGPLDLREPRDWDRDIDQELRDAAFYRACKREADRRALVSQIAARPDDEVVVDLRADLRELGQAGLTTARCLADLGEILEAGDEAGQRGGCTR